MAWDAPTMAGLAEVTTKQCNTVSEARRRFSYALERLRAEGFSLSQSNNLVEARDGGHLIKLYMWAPGPAKMLNPAKLLKNSDPSPQAVDSRQAHTVKNCQTF